MRFRLFGGVAAFDGDRAVDLGPPKQRAVLAVLLLEAGHAVPAERLVSLLWEDDAPKATVALRAYVSNLRKVLEPERGPRDEPVVLVTQGRGYRAAVRRDAVDVLRFEDLVAEGRTARFDGDVALARRCFGEALDLWTGAPAPELEGTPVGVETTTRLAAVRAAATEGLADVSLALGDPTSVVALLEPAIAVHPLRERMHALLAVALYQEGRQADALDVVRRAQESLLDVGLTPGRELQELETGILDHAPGLARATAAGRPAAIAPAAVAPAAPGGASDLFGREAELGRLVTTLESAVTGRGTAAVVLGEPGIGKTRLVEALAESATTAGVAVAWARCPESAATPPYWPVDQLLAQLTEAGALHGSEPAGTGGESSQFALHDALGRRFTALDRPALVIVDDLQWADADSLRFLAQVARSLTRAPLLVVATTRPLAPDSPPPLLDAIAELSAVPGAVRLDLHGLDRLAVATWLRTRGSPLAADDLATLVHDRTGGNPLFVHELAELLFAGDRAGDPGLVSTLERSLPTGVQIAVRRRVSRLPTATQQVLGPAAVLGRTFELDALAAVAGEPPDAVLECLGPALGAGLLVETDSPVRWSFAHAIVADALAAEVNAGRRARVHATAARTLAARGQPELDAVIAYHARLGIAAGTAELAYAASVRAARASTARLAHEDAVAHWETALQAADLLPPGDVDRVAVLLELGHACVRADLPARAQEVCLAVLDLVGPDGDPRARSRAVELLDAPHLWTPQVYGEVDLALVNALERALAPGSGADAATRAMTYGALSVALAYSPDADRLAAARAATIQTARTCGDPAVLAHALVDLCRAPGAAADLATRAGAAAELGRLAAEGALDDELVLIARVEQAAVAYEQADLDTAEELLAAAQRLMGRAGEAGVRSQVGYFAAVLAAARGRYEQARAIGHDAAIVHRRTRRAAADVIGAALDLAVAADVGGLDAHVPLLASVAAGAGAYRAVFERYSAWLLLELGDVDAARAVVAPIDLAAPLPDDYLALFSDCAALQVAAELGLTEVCRRLVERVAPFAGRWTGPGIGPATLGLVEASLARGAAAAGDAERAAGWFDAAAAGHQRLRTPAWLARTLTHQAAFLDGRDAAAAGAAAARASAIAASLGLPYVARRLAVLR